MSAETGLTLLNITLWIGIAFTAIGTIGSQYLTKVIQKEKDRSASTKQDELLDQNRSLLEKIDIYQADLKEKDEKIKELDKKAKMSARGVTSMYSFNGTKRQTYGGNIKADAGEEFGIFQQMVDLENSKNYPALIDLCEQQIKKTPDWFTPYFFKGVAQANRGLKDEAIKNIRYVVDNTIDDPEYEEAREILEKLERQP
jgi:tetratricopeptide (TPR) repeat protein